MHFPRLTVVESNFRHGQAYRRVDLLSQGWSSHGKNNEPLSEEDPLSYENKRLETIKTDCTAVEAFDLPAGVGQDYESTRPY